MQIMQTDFKYEDIYKYLLHDNTQFSCPCFL